MCSPPVLPEPRPLCHTKRSDNNTSAAAAAAASQEREENNSHHKKNNKNRVVSFVISPEIVVVERLELSFYQPCDFQRFRQETQADLEAQAAATAVRLEQTRDELLAKRQRGYQMLTARRNQRLGLTSKSSRTTASSTASSHCRTSSHLSMTRLTLSSSSQPQRRRQATAVGH